MTGWRLLLTRPTDESTALSAVLAEAGIFSSALPLLEIEPLVVDGAGLTKILNLPFYSAAIVVSKPAARLGLDLVDQYWPQPPLLPWFTVGAATARLLDDYGLRVDYPADGDDSEALLDLPALQEALAQPDPRVLILRGEGGRELLAERLRGQGASVDYLELYRRCLPAYAEGTLIGQIRAERLNGLVVSSGQGFEHLRQLAGAAWPEVARLPLFVPSPRVAQMARAAGAQHVVDCRGANATALLAALREFPVPAF
ncbi:uroporphyrinogen-III synthase [Pseudomonas gingeri NCPPB 3146 = LMG 5327]|uniref:Uroporphyrinogen-III synthase n=2 Tax=Pseudomonas gingeri TaxID=117681 RepID=A0A7Y7XXZ3_9PSED|nr:uroporphyrinogen-III synthase [Pseudomonas gingeri]NVZ28863.1 uroporphyrinogen-III synthase [Pseudomonas gingeri]NWC14379.1 uroporphyrinogen-III synthase [Pseudomonas gingeri]NWE47131.1 uroporphyrinogen-III synthase [Pseudomonas gingeri]PNQ88809.1 uroporphyrinogen-III synthase [Pseudomonas gingeri NCPPB 3146 = LMG 5327]